MSVDPGIKAKITLRLTDIKLKEAVKFIIRENGCSFKVVNGIIQIFEAPPVSEEYLKPAGPEQVFAVKGNLLSVDFKNADLDSVIRWVSVKAGKNIILEKGLTAEITAYFNDMPIEKGLRALFETNGLEIIEKDGLSHLIPAGGGFDAEAKSKPSRVKHFVTVKNKKASFNVNNAPISDIIKEIARQADLQVYMYNDLAGSITAKVDSISVDEAFENLLRNTSATFWISKGIYFFADKSTYEKKVIDLIPVNYLQAEEISSLLPTTVTAKATIKNVKEYNALLIEASTSDIIEQAKDFVALIDKPIAQILIEAWVVEVKIDKLRKYGVKLFSKSDGQTGVAKTYFPTYQTESDRKGVVNFIDKYLNVSSNVVSVIPKNFAIQIEALENEGISNLISRPQVATLNGHTATITFGTTQFYLLEKSIVVPGTNTNLIEKVQEREVININMTLSVTPWVSSNNEVTMEITPTFDVPGASPGPNLPPPINRRSLNSKVRVKTGEMIILGGLIGESKNEFRDKVPFIGSIPVIGWFFSTRKTEKNKTQLMIYLIPHVYYGSERSVDPATIDFRSARSAVKYDGKKESNKKPWYKRWMWWK